MRLVDVTDIEKFICEKVCVIGDDHLLLVAADDGKWHEALPLIKTAYDVDKVVEELEKEKSGLTTWAEDEAFKLGIDKAISIVRGKE